jgi:hypothetical protein
MGIKPMVSDEKKTTLPPEGGPLGSTVLNDMRGTLFKNLKKQKPTHSDYYGEICVDGYEYWMNGWIHTDINGIPFVKLQFKPKPGPPDDKPVSTKGKDFL